MKEYINNFNNKTVVITGATSGIGLELVKKFIECKANVIMAIRNTLKAKEIINKLNYENITYFKIDLKDKESVYDFINHIKQIDIDIFINNAGVFHLDKSFNKDNKETVMSTNYINVYLLNKLLIDYFLSLNHKVDILFTSSLVYKYGKLNYDDFYMLKRYKKMQVYANSKLAITRYFIYLAKKYENSNLKICLVHPGIVYTPLINKAYKTKIFVFCAKLFMKLFFNNINNAALIDLYALNDNIKHGSFIGPSFLQIKGKPKIIKIKKIAYQDINELISFSEKEIL